MPMFPGNYVVCSPLRGGKLMYVCVPTNNGKFGEESDVACGKPQNLTCAVHLRGKPVGSGEVIIMAYHITRRPG